MTGPARILIVDDSAIVRRLVSTALKDETDLVVAGTAADGRAALDLLETTTFDAVVLDIDMPVMNGLTTLVELRKRWRHLPVVMFSTLTEKGAAITLEALEKGASDYVTKPATTRSLADSLSEVRDELAPRLRALTRAGLARVATIAPPTRRPSAHVAHAGPVAAVVIGVSTGGPKALADVIPDLPANLAVPVVIVQHMPPTFTRLLAERLASKSALPVVEVDQEMPAQPGCVYVAPGGRHLAVTKSAGGPMLVLRDTAPVNSCRPSVDILFASAAKIWGAGTMAVVLTGMGQDGLEGSKLIRDVGGTVLAQDQASSVVWGMPGAVASAGVAHEVVPLSEIANQIIRRGRVTNRSVPA